MKKSSPRSKVPIEPFRHTNIQARCRFSQLKIIVESVPIIQLIKRQIIITTFGIIQQFSHRTQNSHLHKDIKTKRFHSPSDVKIGIGPDISIDIYTYACTWLLEWRIIFIKQLCTTISVFSHSFLKS